MTDLRYSRLSPPGRGAILVIEVAGDGRHEFLAEMFSSGVEDRVRYGAFRDRSGQTIDDGLCVPLEESTLVTVHGNPVLADRILAELRKAGAREAPGRFPGGTCRLEVEALELLPRAPTEGAVSFLLAQGHAAGVGLAAWRERVLDGSHSPSVQELESMIEGARLADALFAPPQVLLAGVPNAGKSTLFNYLVGQDRVVTHEVPGTTRDLIEEVVPMGPFPVRLCDGAGLRSARECIEAEGVRRVTAAVRECDLVVLLTPVGSVDRAATDAVRRIVESDARRYLEVSSRCDEGASSATLAVSGLAVSGATGEGVAPLESRILEALFGTRVLPASPTPFLPRHREILERALHDLSAGRSCRDAVREL